MTRRSLNAFPNMAALVLTVTSSRIAPFDTNGHTDIFVSERGQQYQRPPAPFGNEKDERNAPTRPSVLTSKSRC
jgi:hypothetical protein